MRQVRQYAAGQDLRVVVRASARSDAMDNLALEPSKVRSIDAGIRALDELR
jgi:hypothetical protein